MAKNGFKVIDSDMHVMEPPELWEKYIDKKFRDRAPRGVTSHNVRDLRLVHPDGVEWSRKTTPANDTVQGQEFRREAAYPRQRRRPRLDLGSAARSYGYRRHRHRRALSDPRPARPSRRPHGRRVRRRHGARLQRLDV